jgi:diguanylate cyclase (GGDEF)-like protein
MDTRKVLIVDDDQLMREMLSDCLRVEGIDVRTAGTGEEALLMLEEAPADVIIADLVMPGMGGLDVLDRIKRLQPRPDVIIVTGYGTVESAVKALRLGACDYFQKPVNPESLLATVARALEGQRLLRADGPMRAAVELWESCRWLMATSDRARLFEQGLRALLSATGAGAGELLLWEWGQSDVEVATEVGLGDERSRALARQVEDLVLGAPAERPFVASLGEGGAALLVPLSRGEQVSAAMVSLRERESDFTPEHVHAASYLADHICWALERCQRTVEGSEQAFVDELTGLYNARYFDVVLGRELTLAQQSGNLGHTFSVLLVDIDHIKEVNDRFGHLTGSKVLVELGRVLRRCVREVDPVFRYGGDEFTILLRSADAAGAAHVAERIRRSIEAHPFLAREGLELRLTASIGVSNYPEHASTKERLVDLADAALFQGKKATRNTVVVAG